MRYKDLLENHIIKDYCRVMDIKPDALGRITKKEAELIRRYLYHKVKIDRRRNAEAEELNKIKASRIMGAVLDQIKVESPIEEVMRDALIVNGLAGKFETQYKICTKRVDFAFPDSFLVVECDGREYHFMDHEQIEKDQKRDKYLAHKGWRVLHFDGLMIRRNIKECVKIIKGNL